MKRIWCPDCGWELEDLEDDAPFDQRAITPRHQRCPECGHHLQPHHR